jgi:hypothetical protein
VWEEDGHLPERLREEYEPISRDVEFSGGLDNTTPIGREPIGTDMEIRELLDILQILCKSSIREAEERVIDG